MNASVPSRVSVVIPCYRHAHYLAGCLDSALSQGVDVEVIVVNDGSPDNTADVAARYAGRITYIEQANAGLAAARNRGIDAAHGEFLAFLDSDDELVKGGLAAFLAAADANPAAGVFCGGHAHMNEDGVAGQVLPAPSFQPDPFHALIDTNAAPPVAYFFRTAAVRNVGGFDRDSTFYGHEDWAMLLALAARGETFVRVSAVVARYRVSEQSMTSANATRMFASGLAVLDRYRCVHSKCRQCDAIVTRSIGRRLKFWILELLLRRQRLAAAKLTLGHFSPLVRGGQLMFAAMTPALIVAPTRLIRRRWRPSGRSR